MKLTYLIDSFPPLNPTSPGILTFALAKEMKRRGHGVSIITTVQDKGQVGCETREGLEIHSIFSNFDLRWQSYFCLYNPETASEVRKLLRAIKPDVCHFQNIQNRLSYHCLATAAALPSKVLITCHDVMAFNYGKLTDFIDPYDLAVNEKFDYRVKWLSLLKQAKKRYNPARNILIRHFLRRANGIFAVSNALKDALNQNKIGNVSVIHNALDMAEWSKTDVEAAAAFRAELGIGDGPVIFFGGRLSGAKGGKQLMEAFEQVRREVPEAALLVVGKKNHYSDSLMEAAASRNLAGAVFFTGWIDGADLKSAYAACDLAVVPSICFDSFPTVNLEAMAQGKPVIATCFGGSREAVLDQITGFIVNPYNITDLAAKIALLLKDKQLAKQFGDSGRKRALTAFDLHRQADELEKIYGN